MKRWLYTFFFEFQGGTYISQVRAANPNEAKKLWAEQLPVEAIPNFGKRMQQQIVRNLMKKKRSNWIASLMFGVSAFCLWDALEL